MIRSASLFSGIGTQEMALHKLCSELGYKHEIVFFCEIEPTISVMFTNIHSRSKHDIHNIGDISNVHKRDIIKYRNKVDILTCSFPCQAFSIAGKRQGTCDPRGGLIYDALRVINHIQPTVVVFENVKNIKNFPKIISDIKRILSNYSVSDFVLDAGNYGSAQHRERWFGVAIRSRSHYIDPPSPIYTQKTVFDILDMRVRKRHISSDLIPYMKRKYMNLHAHPSSYGLIKLFDGVAQNYFKSGYSVHRIYSIHGKSPTLTTTNDTHYYEIGGKLTSRERWRLMGCSDHDYDVVVNTLYNLHKVSSNKLDKCDVLHAFIDRISGNAIVVECIYHVFKEIFHSV